MRRPGRRPRRSFPRRLRRAGRLAGLRSKLRDARYLERAIRSLAQILIDGALQTRRK